MKTNVLNGVLAVPKRGTGAYWLWERRNYQGDNCLIWPFSKNEKGYGQVGYERTVWKAHKLMCSFVHGERRYPEYEVCHTCSGKKSCVNPKHLVWGNKSMNMLDRRRDGTKAQGRVWKLTPEKVAQIRSRGAYKVKDLAKEFGVSEGTIRQILSGQLWRSGKYSVSKPNRTLSEG